uniref:Peptidase S54 rhomboid domain-containing protein n=1 Tax=Aegilops tauschii subsp. strangulata TaxID=200361 RepID=A0A453PYF7_AEGTS
MLTSSFSHMDLKHLFNNMVGLYFFGSSIARTFGPGFLFQLYVTGALTGSVFYLAEKIFLAPRKEVFGGWKTPCLVSDFLSYSYIIYYSEICPNRPTI